MALICAAEIGWEIQLLCLKVEIMQPYEFNGSEFDKNQRSPPFEIGVSIDGKESKDGISVLTYFAPLHVDLSQKFIQ